MNRSVQLIEVLIVIVYIFGMLRYWNWKLKNGYSLGNENLAYGIFLGGQLLGSFIILWQGIDPQASSYLEGHTLFGKHAWELWSYFGMCLFGFALTHILAHFTSLLVVNFSVLPDGGLYEEIRGESIGAGVIGAMAMVVMSFTWTYFVMRPFLFEWALELQTGIITLN